MPIAPIALFVYNRPEHTRRAVEALQKNNLASKSEMIIFSDGPKEDKAEEEVQKVREYLKTITGFKSVSIVERTNNFGLAESIISGVTEIVNKFGKIIVLEDDLVASPHFLKYMNDALDLYEKEDRVISIHGYVYPIKEKLPETFFLRGADCWGWGTWKRGWKLFESDGQKLFDELITKKLTKKFDLDGVYPYTQMLQGQIMGFNNSWAIRWYASAFLKNKLTLYPGKTLVNNVGFDGSGTNTGKLAPFKTQINHNSIKLESILIEENNGARESINKYFKEPKLRLTILLMRIKFYTKVLIS